MKKLVLTLPFLLLANLAFAAGFGLYEFSGRGNAMGGAVLAGEAEPASLALNPALITKLPGKQIQGGITVVTASGGVVYNNMDANAERQWWPLPNIFYTQQINENWWWGLGAMARFGLSNDYADAGWMLPTGTTGASLKHVGVTTFSVQPTVAYKATDKLSVSLGAEVQYLNFTEKLRFGNKATLADMADLNLNGDSYSLSGMVAVSYDANDKLSFGASFRSKNDHHVRGPNKYDYVNPLAVANFVRGGDFWGDIAFPAQLALGASWKPTEKLLLEFNWTQVFWSCFKAINIYFDNLPGQSGGGEGMLGNATANGKKYHDVFRVGLGAEYTLTDAVKLRGSFIFDKSPLNHSYMDAMLPVDDRYIFGAGAGFKLSENTVLDLSYNLLFATSLDGVSGAGLPVHYKSATSHLMGLSVRYKF